MSIFGSIMSAIFGHASSETSAAPTTPAPADSTPASPTAQPVPTSEQPTAAARPGPPVDVAAIMDKLAQQAGQKLDWRRSIVDLMKLINLDSSLTARKELAQELNYTGNMNDTASMNIWLHKQVMIKLAENGGKVPDELKH
jgi:Domain of unknown function (DUF3597)